MKIETHQHGDRDLWIALAPFATSRAVLAELGGPIYSTPETTWLVAYDGAAGEVVGFAAWRRTKSGVYYDYAYVVDGQRKAGIFEKLAKRRDELATAAGDTAHAIVRKARVKHYRARGWTVQSERGQWTHLVRATKARAAR